MNSLSLDGLVSNGKGLPYNPNLKVRANELRRSQTNAEKRLWYDFLSGCGHKFLRQKVIGHYIVDFYCAKRRLVIEVDGRHHYTRDGLTYDAIRSDFLAHLGVSVLRFENRDVVENFSVVCDAISQFLKSGSVLIEEKHPQTAVQPAP